MTEKELDARIRQLLLDALKLEWEEFLNEPETEPPAEPSKRHQKQVRKMLADPKGWADRRARPVWKNALQKAAVFALVGSIILGSLLAASPQARAALKRWFRKVFDTHVYYEYAGEPSEETLPEYEMTVVPEGYELVDAVKAQSFLRYTYQNQGAQLMHLIIASVQQGQATSIYLDGFSTHAAMVKQCPATILVAHSSKQSNSITWIDDRNNLQFTIEGYFDLETLCTLAESVKEKVVD